MPAKNTIQIRKGIDNSWSAANPVLASGEPGYDISNKILKVGDGSTPWNSLENHHHTSSNITDFNTAVSGLTSGLQPLLTNPVTGVGTSGYIAKWNGSNYIGNSIIFENSSNIGIGTSLPTAKLSISNGFLNVDGDSQILVMTLRKETTDNIANNLYIDNISKKMTIPWNTVWNFDIRLSCISDSVDGAASFNFRGAIKHKSSVSFIGSYIEENFIDPSLSGINSYLVANDSTLSLDIMVQGLGGSNIRWTAGVNLVQTSFASGGYFVPLKTTYEIP